MKKKKRMKWTRDNITYGKIKLLLKDHAIKTCGGMKVQLRTFLASAL